MGTKSDIDWEEESEYNPKKIWNPSNVTHSTYRAKIKEAERLKPQVIKEVGGSEMDDETLRNWFCRF